jgi:hypothetical protein
MSGCPCAYRTNPVTHDAVFQLHQNSSAAVALSMHDGTPSRWIALDLPHFCSAEEGPKSTIISADS